MSTRGGVRIPITADARGVGDGVRDAERALDRLNKSANRSFSGLKVGAVAAAAAVGTGFVAAMRTGVAEMLEAEKVSAQTAAAIRSTGGAAGVTQKQVEGLASQLQALTGVEDDQIQSAQNLLLTFTKIGRETFPAATKAALDMSVRFDQSLKSSAIQLGKALQDPIQGVSALTRIGVSFSDQQKEQIRVLVESNRVQAAQAVILREVNKQAGGASQAFGQSLAGKLQRLSRAWEDTSQAIAVAFLPVLERVADAALKNQGKLEGVFKGIAKAVNGLVGFVGAIIEGDWEKAWDIATTSAGKALRAIGVLAEKVLLPLAKKAGRAVVQGLADGIDEALQTVRGSGALRRILGFDSAEVTTFRARVVWEGGTTVPTPPGAAGGGDFASGGVIPGPRGAGDIVPAMLSPGEVVLNERQQRLLGTDRIMGILAATGGVMGGRFFARGGWVHPAPGASMGGGPGQGTHSFSAAPHNWQSDMAYDLMGHDGMPVVAAYDGVISGTRPFSSDPRFWGMAAYLNVPGGQFYYKHMKSLAVKPGQRVAAGQVIGHLGAGVNGGPHLHIGATSRGLLDRAIQGARVPPNDGDDHSHETPDDEAREAPKMTFGQLLEQATRGAPGGVVGRTTRTKAGSVTVGTEVSSIAGAYRGAVPDVSAGFDTSPGGADSRAIDRAGRDARAGARAAGKSPEEVRREGDEAEAEATKAWYRREIRQINRAMANLKKRKARLLQSIADLRASRVGKPAAKRRVIRALSGRIAQINAELSELREIRAELQNSLGEIIDAEQMEDYESTASTDDTAATGTATDTGGVAPVDEAELVRARTNMLMTEWNMVTGGAGDMGTGGVTAMDAAFPGGRTVTLTVGATSLVSAVASASGTQGYSTPAVVPAGV